MPHPRRSLLLCLCAVLISAPLPAATRPPNVIIILVDDFGVTDLACYGSRLYVTPNVDRLAKDGVRFTEGYSACTVCSPTRAALLTGKSPARLHITDWIPGENPPKAKLKIPDWQKFLPFEEVTLAEQLKAAGYATASIGKWHLTPGLAQGDEAYYPDKHGFDVNIGGYHSAHPPSYFSPYNIPTLVDGPKGEFLTDREAGEAVKFMEANRDRPFFIYLPHYAVHQPLDGKKDVIAKYKAKVDADPTLKQRNATYAALVESVDDAVGTIRAGLKRLKLDDNTIIIFTVDNGGKIGPTDNSPYRVGKGSAYEGGIRVPLIVYWPGVTKAGTTDATPNVTHDLYPTVLEMTGIAAQKTVVDGVSLASRLKSGTPVERDALYWHYPHYHGGGATPHSAIRKGDFRLIHFYEDGHDELYDLAHDIGEVKNLAAAQPQKAKELRAQLDAYLKSVGAQLPTPNPNYDPNAGKAKGPAAKKAVKEEVTYLSAPRRNWAVRRVTLARRRDR